MVLQWQICISGQFAASVQVGIAFNTQGHISEKNLNIAQPNGWLLLSILLSWESNLRLDIVLNCNKKWSFGLILKWRNVGRLSNRMNAFFFVAFNVAL